MKIEDINLDNFNLFCEQKRLNHQSQIKQDLFVLFVTNMKKNGFFVEFGACDGLELNNTFLLENEFNWSGILAEPSIGWHENLFKNRKCVIDTRAVYSESNKNIEFIEVDKELNTLSGIKNENFLKNFNDIRLNTKNKKYLVKTVTLIDLLKENNAPNKIDYLSIDTEGTEYEIIKNFNFDSYDISIITIEHFFNELEKQKIYDLLVKNGYSRVLTEISGQDDWYVKK